MTIDRAPDDAGELEATPLEVLHLAIQTFSNSLCTDSSQVGLVTAGLVVWEESQFDEDGDTARSVHYAATGDGSTPGLSIGLAYIGLERVSSDVLGGHS